MNEEELVTRYSALHAGRDRTKFGVLDVLHAEGSGLDALLYGVLLWPSFVEYQGMIFRLDTVEDDDDRRRVDDALKRYGGDRRVTERSSTQWRLARCSARAHLRPMMQLIEL